MSLLIKLYRHYRVLMQLCLSASVLTCLGCGWQLRGYDQLNPLAQSTLPELESLNVISENRNNAFFRSFQRALLRQGIKLDDDSAVQVEMSPETIRRQPLTYNRSGVPSQYQLTMSLAYFAYKNEIVLIEQREIVSRRNYDFDPNLIIAKDREEQVLLDEMRQELSNKIVSSIRRAL